VHSKLLGNGGYAVGSNTFKDVLRIIQRRRPLQSRWLHWLRDKGSNNLAIVTDTGSSWSNGISVLAAWGEQLAGHLQWRRGVAVSDTSHPRVEPFPASTMWRR